MFLSSFDGNLRDPFVFPQESPFTMRVVSGHRDSSPSVPGPRSSSGAEAGISGILSSADMDLRHPMEFQQGIQALSRVETCKSAFLSSCNSIVKLPVELT